MSHCDAGGRLVHHQTRQALVAFRVQDLGDKFGPHFSVVVSAVHQNCFLAGILHRDEIESERTTLAAGAMAANAAFLVKSLTVRNLTFELERGQETVGHFLPRARRLGGQSLGGELPDKSIDAPKKTRKPAAHVFRSGGRAGG